MKYPIPVVRVILEDSEGKILFIKRTSEKGKGKLCLPGGKVECGQTLEEAVVLESKQETDLDVFNISYLFYQDGSPQKWDKKYLTHYFLADFKGKLKLNGESSKAIKIKLEDLSNYRDKISFGNYDGVLRYLAEKF